MTTTEIARIDEAPQAVTLFGTEDPDMFLARASKTATALKSMIVSSNLTTKIQGRDYVRVEGWTALGSMLGVFPVTEWTRRIEREGDQGWEARVKAVTRTGDIIGAAEASCMRSEQNWRSRDDYALRSMAQTRATSKALRQPLGFVVSLAGYEATPAEEIPRDGFTDAKGPKATKAQLKEIGDLLVQLELDPEAVTNGMVQEYGTASSDELTKLQAEDFLTRLRSKVAVA